MPLILRYLGQTSVPVEIEGLVPDRLREKSPAEIERLEIFHGNRKLPLAELFSVTGDPSDARMEFEGNLAGVHFIGYGMTAGEIHVHGNAGRHLGGEMTGGGLLRKMQEREQAGIGCAVDAQIVETALARGNPVHLRDR